MGRPAKALTELGGIPMFLHSFRALRGSSQIAGVVILVPEANVDAAAVLLELEEPGIRSVIASGGDTRQASVRRGLDVLPEQADVVICHDAARPFASTALIDRVIRRLYDLGAASVDGVVPVVPSPDTVKRVRDGVVLETVPRDELGLVQTPQAFRRLALEDAHRQAERSGLVATDDATLLEVCGYRVAAVEGEARNFKITTPEDLRRAAQLRVGEGMA
jgi:2-C-methyl-D-erythritol 4-phosphate cytidylyltransferase